MGLTVPATAAELVHVQHVFMPDGEWLGFYFEFPNVTEAPRKMEPHKHDRMEWLDLPRLSEPVVPYVEAALGQIASGSKFSTFVVRAPHP